MRQILVPTDFSKEAATALPHVKEQVKLAGSSQVQVILLTVIGDLVPANIDFEFGLALVDTKKLEQEALRRAQERMTQLVAEHFSGMHVEQKILTARKSVYDEILTFANDNKVDMIIMATHGRAGFKHLVLGSVTERIVRGARCPVLVIPAQS